MEKTAGQNSHYIDYIKPLESSVKLTYWLWIRHYFLGGKSILTNVFHEKENIKNKLCNRRKSCFSRSLWSEAIYSTIHFKIQKKMTSFCDIVLWKASNCAITRQFVWFFFFFLSSFMFELKHRAF